MDTTTTHQFKAADDVPGATKITTIANLVLDDKSKIGQGDAKKSTINPVIHQESKADYPSRLVYPPLSPGIPNPTKPEFIYSEEDADNDGTILTVQDDQYTFVALLE